MSRLDSVIRRLQAQRSCIDHAIGLIAGRPGPVFEVGLGNGRTYDHLRARMPDRTIYAFDRQVAAHPNCIPPGDHLVLGDARRTLPATAAARGRAVLVVGLDYMVGIAGKRLTAVQRQKVGLARGLIKHPDLLVINSATAVFDGSAQARVLGRMLEDRKGQGVVWVLDRDDFADKFDRVLALRDGKMVERDKLAAE